MAIDAATLKLRFPAFAAVDDVTIAYWLTDAARIVTSEWGDDQEPGSLVLAAHSMALNRVAGIAQDDAAQIPAGVTSFRSGTFSVSVDPGAAAASAAGGYGATVYGREFAVMLRRNVGGPVLIGDPC